MSIDAPKAIAGAFIDGCIDGGYCGYPPGEGSIITPQTVHSKMPGVTGNARLIFKPWVPWRASGARPLPIGAALDDLLFNEKWEWRIAMLIWQVGIYDK